MERVARSLEEVLRELADANLKLDHIIATYRSEREDFRHGLYDPFNGYYQQ